jgi:hypothetical protein
MLPSFSSSNRADMALRSVTTESTKKIATEEVAIQSRESVRSRRQGEISQRPPL